MISYKMVEKFVDVKDEVTCNRCEATAKYGTYGADFHSAYYHGGFTSKLGDGNEYAWDLCEDCLKWLFDQFKINPQLPESNSDDESSC